MSSPQDIVITGIGIICAGVCSPKDLWFRMQYSLDGIVKPRNLKTAHAHLPMGEVIESNAELEGYTQSQKLSRTSLLGLYAARQAISDAGGLDGKTAFISGTTVGNMDAAEQAFMDVYKCDSPQVPGHHDCGSSTIDIAMALGLPFSFVSTISTACSSAANAIMDGADMLRLGVVDCVLAGGAEALSAFHVGGFNSLMILDNNHCRPFSDNRHGLNLGEGAAYLVMETRRHAQERGARILAVLAGSANVCDAYHQTATSPDGDGPYLAMSQALKDAEMLPENISFINAHGTGTPNNDSTEATAIARLFNPIPPIFAPKFFTGHTTSASGAIEAVISIVCLVKDFIPGNPGADNITPELNMAVSKSSVRKHINAVMSNSFGFGGNDSCLIFTK